MDFCEWLHIVETQLPQPIFTGWAEFVHELNLFINRFVHKIPEEDLEHALMYVTLFDQGSEKEDSAKLELSMSDYDWNKEAPPGSASKRLAAVKYFLGEMGMNIDKIEKSQHPQTPDDLILHVSGLPRYETPDYSHLDPTGKQLDIHRHNPQLMQALKTGRVLDVQQIGYEVPDPDGKKGMVFRLNKFIPNVDYADGKTSQWIWSIGRSKSTGETFASFDGRYYMNDDYDCLFLR